MTDFQYLLLMWNTVMTLVVFWRSFSTRRNNP